MTRDVHQELIDKFKDEPFSIIDKQGTILNKTHLSSMGYATHIPYSVVGLWDLLTSINELAHKKEDLEKENKQLKKQLRELKNDSTKSRNDREKNCGYCKNYNFDGMFGIWCSIHETPTSDKYCQDFEWNR